jgi:nitrate/nitrite-specific signal transduction histidine kinase
VLRSLLANATAAGARHIRVSAIGRGDRRSLVVDDDGGGLGSADRYGDGTPVSLALCRWLLARFEGVLELRPRAAGGTRAMIVLRGADG